MDELDRIARDAVDEVHATAARVADTEQALADVHSGVRLAQVVGLGEGPRRRRPGPLLAAVAAVVVVTVGVAVWTTGDDDARIAPADTTTAPDVPTDDSTDDSAVVPSSTAAETTVPPTAPPFPAATTPDGFTGLYLRHGIRIPSGAIPGDLVTTSSIDTFGWRGDLRSSYVDVLSFADGRSIRIRLGALDTDRYPLRDDAPELGLGGWTLDGLASEVAAAAGYGIDADTWITVEALRTFDIETSTFLDDAFSLDEIRAVLVGLEYDPSADDRTRATTTLTGSTSPESASPCAEDVTVSGTGGRGDLVLFTCDGLLARYDGDTGQRLEVLATFPDPTQPAPEEGSVPYVDSIVVSPDGTIWWSVGPEPVSDTLYRFTPGVSTEPELVGSGIVQSASPDGRWVAASTAMPSIELRAVDSSVAIGEGDAVAGFDTWGTYVNRPVWSPDSRRIVAEVSDRGALAVMDMETGSIRYHAPLGGQVYRAPWFDADGVLHAIVDDGTTMQDAVVGDPGNAPPVSVGPLTVPELGRVPLSAVPSDMFAVLSGGRLEFLDATWATGVIVAAVVPPTA